MKSELIEQAHRVVPDTALLINAVSQRVAQLTQGFSPLIKVDPSKHGSADIALLEIIQGKVTIGEAARLAAAAAAQSQPEPLLEDLAQETELNEGE